MLKWKGSPSSIFSQEIGYGASSIMPRMTSQVLYACMSSQKEGTPGGVPNRYAFVYEPSMLHNHVELPCPGTFRVYKSSPFCRVYLYYCLLKAESS